MDPTVFLARVEDGCGVAEQAEATGKVLAATGFATLLRKLDMVAVKVHVGEKNNTTHIKPELATVAVQLSTAAGAQPFITDTATLYKGERENAIKHTIHAYRHGFHFRRTGAPFIPVDGLSGSDEVEVTINGELSRQGQSCRPDPSGRRYGGHQSRHRTHGQRHRGSHKKCRNGFVVTLRQDAPAQLHHAGNSGGQVRELR